MEITIENFKGFQLPVTLDLKKNLSVYGENGAGKSSIYEAFKVLFFKNRIEEKILENAKTPEEAEAIKTEFWNNYNNKINDDDFIIEINGIDHNSFTNTNYQTFMISLDELKQGEDLQLDKLLKRYLLDIEDIDALCTNKYSIIETNVNQSLTEFHENISIKIDNMDDCKITLEDTERNFLRKSKIKEFFNEAKINIVTLLILFHSIKQCDKDEQKTQLLVLDDFITSLDVSNKTLILNFLFENFSDFQMVILTHNISFYNLTMYLINDVFSVSDAWSFANLYQLNNQSKIYYKNSIEKIIHIEECFNNIDSGNIQELESIGNRLRQKFEILLYELSKLLMIGAVEDSKKIIDKIANNEVMYLHEKKTADNLLDEIISILEENNNHNLSNRLERKINKYKLENFDNLRDIIKNLKLYQKVTMHPMSHGQLGQRSFNEQEIKITIELLKKLENTMKNLVNTNI